MKENQKKASLFKRIIKNVSDISDADSIERSVNKKEIEPWSVVWIIRQFFAFIVQVFDIVTSFISDGYEKLVDLSSGKKEEEEEKIDE